MTTILEEVAVAIAQGDSSPQRLARRLGCPPSLVRRALQHPELPWLVDQVAPRALLATSVERRLDRLAGEALDVVHTMMYSSSSTPERIRCAGILLKSWQHAQRLGDIPPASSPPLSTEVLDLLRGSRTQV